MTGIGIIIIVQQIFPIAGMASPSSNPLVILSALGDLAQGIRLDAVFLAAATVASIYVIPRFIRAVPPSLIALVVLTLLAVLLRLGAPTIGDIPGGLPSPSLPEFALADLKPILTAAIQLAFLGSIDSLTTSLVADNITKTHHDSNRELVGQGIGNMAAALFGGLPGAGAFMRTAINVKAGGRNHSSGVIHGLFLLAVLLGLSGVVQYIPHAVLSGILIGAGLSIIDYRGLSHLLTAPRSDAVLMLTVIGLTIFTDLITAVSVGMIFAAFVFMTKIARISEENMRLTLIDDEPWADELEIPADMRERLLIKHVSGPLFFGFVYAFRASIAQVKDAKLLVLRMEQVSYMDQSGLYALQDILMDLESAGVQVFLVGIAPEQVDRLESIRVIPNLLRMDNVFEDFDTFKKALPGLLG
jgi:SulP family sulfate permease